jgi:tRNA (guanine37-N1)-methyltransferase
VDIDILTLFPEMFQGLLSPGIFKRAIENQLVSINLHNIRDHTHDKHHTVDDYAYGGGSGMLLKPEPIFLAVESIKSNKPQVSESPVVVLSPQGRLFSQQIAQELSGGELAAMVVVDTVVRLIPGVLGSPDSPIDDSHVSGLLEYPQYTRPERFREWVVPKVLLSGNHAQIAKWRREQAIQRTVERRPELLNKTSLTLQEGKNNLQTY